MLALPAADRGRGTTVYRAERGVEPTDAREPRREGDRGHRQRGLVQQGFGALYAASRRDGGRGGAGVPPEQPAQVPGGHAEGLGQVLDGLAVVEKAMLDEP
jgi:hypothetical protein